MAMSGFTPARRQLTALRRLALGLMVVEGSELPSNPREVVASLLALQAQDYQGALWSLGLRTSATTRAEIEAAHQSGAFVRSWPMRGTLHFVRADDLPWMLSLTSERMVRQAAGQHRQLGLDEAQLQRAERIARELLAGGATSSRTEMLAAFEAGGLSTATQRGVHLLGHLARIGVTVLVGHSEWAMLEGRVPHPRLLERPDALREFALRYFLGHGPATVRDFAWWSSLTLNDARAGLSAAREHVDELILEGESYYLRPGLLSATELTGPNPVHLLPGFDEYLLGYSDRSAPLAGAELTVVAPGANGLFLSTVVVDGEVVGTWRRTTRSTRVEVALTPFTALSTWTRREVETAAARYGEFMGLPVEFVS